MYHTWQCYAVYGIAVPTDRELPLNELENIVKRSKASAIIYSPKKEEDIKKLKKEVVKITEQIKEYQNELNRLQITRGVLINRIYELEKKEGHYDK